MQWGVESVGANTKEWSDVLTHEGAERGTALTECSLVVHVCVVHTDILWGVG